MACCCLIPRRVGLSTTTSALKHQGHDILSQLSAQTSSATVTGGSSALSGSPRAWEEDQNCDIGGQRGHAEWQRRRDGDGGGVKIIEVLYPQRTLELLRTFSERDPEYRFRMLRRYAQRRPFTQNHGALAAASMPLRNDRNKRSKPIPERLKTPQYWETDTTSTSTSTPRHRLKRKGQGGDGEPRSTTGPPSAFKIPDDPEQQVSSLLRIVQSHNVLLVDTAWKLWQICCVNLVTRVQVVDMRFYIYNYFRESMRPQDWQRIVLMFGDVPAEDLTELDYRFRLWAMISLDLSARVAETFETAARLFPGELGTQWNMIRRYYLQNEDYEKLFFSWGEFSATTDPLLKQDRQMLQTELRGWLLKFPENKQVDIISAFMRKFGSFGRRVGRIFMSILADLGSPVLAKEVYFHMRTQNPNERDVGQIVRILNKAGRPLESAELLAEYDARIPGESPTSDGLIGIKLETFAANKEYSSMQELFESTLAQGSVPSTFHYNVTMHALGEIGQIDIVNSLFDDMIERQLRIPVQVLGTLMWSRLRVGDVSGAVEVFDSVHKYGLERNDTLYTLMLKAQKISGDTRAMFETFREMLRAGVTPRKEHITTLMSKYAREGNFRSAEQVFTYFKHFEVAPDSSAFNVLAYAYARRATSERVDFAARMDRILQLVREQNLIPDVKLFTTILHGYSRRQDTQGIKRTVEIMNEYAVPMDAATYGVMIHYLGMIRQLPAAENLFNQIAELGIKYDAFHYTALMTAYLQEGNTVMVERKYKDMVSHGVEPSFVTILTVVLSYMDSRRRHAAKSIFEALDRMIPAMPVVDLTSTHYPKTTVPAYLFTQVLKQYQKRYSQQYADVIEALAETNEDRRLAEQIPIDATFECYACLAACNAADWRTVEQRWERLRSALERTHREYDLTTDTFKRGFVGIDKRLVASAISCKIDALVGLQRPEEAEAVWTEMQQLGAYFSNKTWNARVRALAQSPDKLIVATYVAERYLAAGRFVIDLFTAEARQIRTRTSVKRKMSKHTIRAQINARRPRVRFYIENRTLSLLARQVGELYYAQRGQLEEQPEKWTEYQRIRSEHAMTFTLILMHRQRERLKRRMLKRLLARQSHAISRDRFLAWRKHKSIQVSLARHRTRVIRERIERAKDVFAKATAQREVSAAEEFELVEMGRLTRRKYARRLRLLDIQAAAVVGWDSVAAGAGQRKGEQVSRKSTKDTPAPLVPPSPTEPLWAGRWADQWISSSTTKKPKADGNDRATDTKRKGNGGQEGEKESGGEEGS
ncbi:uncharacterized protein V1518DRAFT_412402 [Limtongia smithiae]|uniref:uncharacterized protein n=1 Tax=Limtongia smithiae TaxID=1125753 RepID=UPI0034CDA7D4